MNAIFLIESNWLLFLPSTDRLTQVEDHEVISIEAIIQTSQQTMNNVGKNTTVIDLDIRKDSITDAH